MSSGHTGVTGPAPGQLVPWSAKLSVAKRSEGGNRERAHAPPGWAGGPGWAGASQATVPWEAPGLLGHPSSCCGS